MKRRNMFLAMAAATVLAISACSSGAVVGNKEAYVSETEAAAAADMASENYAVRAELAAEEGYATADTGKVDAINQRKLVKTVNLNLETLAFGEFMQKLTAEMEAVGAYMEVSEISGRERFISSEYASDLRYAHMTVRVPSGKLEDFVRFLEENANTVYKAENVTDYTLQYMDMESRKKSLLMEQESLWELLSKAESVEAIISLQARLSEVRSELEYYESQLRFYDNQVDYSTVNINLSEVEVYQPPQKEGVGARIQRGLQESIQDIIQGSTDIFVALVVSLPKLLLMAIPILVLIFIVRLIQKKAKKRQSRQSNPPLSEENKTTK